MKYELIGKNNYLDPIATVLKNRGIEDIQSFLNPTIKNTHHWSLLKNMDLATDCVISHIKKGSKFYVQVDADPDGYTSAASLILYLKKQFPKIKIQWRLHEGKEHGIILDEIPEDVNIVIIPDSGSNQFKEHKILKGKNIDVVVLDHHECKIESKDAIVVNSQISPEYPNKQFSGVGVTYKFLKALDDKLNIKNADEYLDLVAVGNIADSMDMRSLETRYYVEKGLKNIKNKLLKALYDKQSFSTKGIVNITSTSFYIVPLINACIRVGSMKEKIQMFKAFLEEKELIYYERKKEHEKIEVSTARLLGNLKAKQDRMRNKGLDLIKQRIEEKNLLLNKLLIVDVTEILEKNLTGVVAIKLAEMFKRPTILARYNEKENVLTGSIRGYEKGIIKDFKQFLTDTNKFEFVEGHKQAAGFKIKPNNLVEVSQITNKILEDVKIDLDLYDVDFIFTMKDLKEGFIKEVTNFKNIWGNMVEEPLLAIKEVTVNKDEINLNGKTSKNIKFIHKGIEFIKFFSNQEEYDNLVNQGECLVLDIIGKCSINLWEGKETPQIVIEEYDVVKTKKKMFVF